MSDAIPLRDHSQPCEHGRQISHWPPGLESMCPGGCLVEGTIIDWCKTHDEIMSGNLCRVVMAQPIGQATLKPNCVRVRKVIADWPDREEH